ncbi:MAG TPA: M20/M25/M40 family metallo-hydrolase, partial [Verrucomicrobiae bacterium]|nr:M20/M25/M40 family metallo-hydrolase [Verrucomicrobiae bacterium]
MELNELTQLAARLMSCPTAPFHEAGVRAVVEVICAEHGLAAERDRYGNVLVRLGNSKNGRPLALAAHMDHPGFEIIRRLGPRRWLARFNGGVPDSYFRPRTGVRLHPGPVGARLGRRVGQEKQFELVTDKAAGAVPRFGTWDLVDFQVRDGCIHGCGCDDVLGVAAVLATLIDLKRRRSRVHVIGVLSRAEEVGFQGALALAAAKTLPANSLVVSLETSKEVPPVRMGEGVILRVGDRASIFHSGATRFLTEVAGELAARDAAFRFQRALMPGGACEATAYQEYGYESAAVCIALGNYHNCGPDGR